jgi:hypothetical protein
LEVDPSGRFRIDDVVPGTYQINIYIQPFDVGTILATGQAQFTMPPIPGGVSDQPLEIPDVPVKAN